MGPFRKLKIEAERRISEALEAPTSSVAELQTVVEAFVVWCLREGERLALEEELRSFTLGKKRELDSDRTQPRAVIAQMIGLDGVDPAVERALTALLGADWSDSQIDADRVVEVLPQFHDEVLLLTRMGVDQGFEYLGERCPELDSLAREVEDGLTYVHWPTLVDFDQFLRSRLEHLVGPAAPRQVGILASEVAWRCAYWRLIRGFRRNAS